MDKCIIFLSKSENYLESAKKIKNSLSFDTFIYYIEDFVKLKNKKKLLENSIVYFLCNTYLIKKLLNKTINVHYYVFNKNFFINNYSKLEIQKILKDNNILIPKILNSYEYKLPIFIKENKHAGIVIKAYTKNTINIFMRKFHNHKFYMEEDIYGDKEAKYYYVKGKIFSKDDNNLSKGIIECCNKISKILDLDIFSVDIIKKNDLYIVIDVNSSAGFYLLDEARNKLVEEIESKR